MSHGVATAFGTPYRSSLPVGRSGPSLSSSRTASLTLQGRAIPPARPCGENHSVMIASEKVMAPILIAKTSLGRLIALGVRFYNRSVIRQPAPPNPCHRDCHSLTSSTSIGPSPLQCFRSASFPPSPSASVHVYIRSV